MPEETSVQQPTSIDQLQPKMCLQGTITRTELYGAFVDIGMGQDGLIHISRMAQQRVRKVTDRVNVGDKVTVWVQQVDPEKGRIALTMVEPPALDWSDLEPGKIYQGRVTRIERYGAFVDIGAERPGLLHVREMGTYVRNPEEVVRLNGEVEVKILSVDRAKKQIDLSMDIEPETAPAEDDEDAPMLSPMEIAYRQAQSRSNERRGKGKTSRRRESRQSDYDDMDDIFRRTLKNER